jgi:hypothetical protein
MKRAKKEEGIEMLIQIVELAIEGTNDKEKLERYNEALRRMKKIREVVTYGKVSKNDLEKFN